MDENERLIELLRQNIHRNKMVKNKHYKYIMLTKLQKSSIISIRDTVKCENFCNM